MTPIEHASASLVELGQRYSWLAASVWPGTARPYRAPTLDAEQRQARDHSARLERQERAAIAPGDSPDPYHFDTAELRDLISNTVEAMAVQVSTKLGACLVSGWSVQGWLRLCAEQMAVVAEAAPALPAQVARKADQLVQRADVLLGNITDGQTLDATCFVCDSRDAAHPMGGGRTLRYRRRHRQHGVAEECNLGCRDYVVCEGKRCAPTEAQCGNEFRGHPAWDLATEAEWLADRIGASPVQPPCERCGEPVVRVSSGPTPHRYCTPECHRAARAEARRAERALAA